MLARLPVAQTLHRTTLSPAQASGHLARRLHAASATAMAPALAAQPTDTAVRQVKRVVQGQKMMEGAGVRICRTVGTGSLRNLDPFLMLDELRMPAKEATAGFPSHPHRGFETCSIMITGKMQHKDSYGNEGVISDGGVQWMTAGRGIIHSEMPVITGNEPLWGFQLWINLPAKDKMTKPQYQDYQAESIPIVESEGCRVRVMAGSAQGVTGPVFMRNPGMLLDVELAPGATFQQQVPSHWSIFAYVSDGEGSFHGHSARREQAVIFDAGDQVQAESSKGMRFLLIAGAPIGEPIKQYGPFVMNTQEEIEQAFHDYQSGRLQSKDDDVWTQ